MFGFRKEWESNRYLFEALDESEFDKRKWILERAKTCERWYLKKACYCRWNYYFFSMMGIVCPALITVVESLDTALNIRSHAASAAVISLSAIVGICTSVLALFKMRDQWLSYRAAAEYIKRECSLYVAGTGTYKNRETADDRFLANLEKYMLQENEKWLTINQEDAKMGGENSDDKKKQVPREKAEA